MLDLIFEGLASLLVDAAVAGAAALVTVTVFKFLDRNEVKKQAKMKCPGALKVVILEKKKNALKTGIFENNSREISTELEINAPYGVSDSLRVGEEIML